MQDNEGYNYNLFCNDKAIATFIEKEKIKVKIDAKFVRILAYLIKLADNERLDFYIDGGVRYTYVSSSIILNQLKFINVDRRALRTYLGKMNELGFIRIIIRGENKRFVAINSNLLSLWDERTGSYDLKPSEFLAKYDLERWNHIKQNYVQYIKTPFKEVIESFDNSYKHKGHKQPMNVISIFDGLIKYLEQCMKHDRLGTPKEQRVKDWWG